MAEPTGPQQQLAAGIQGVSSGTKAQAGHGLISQNHSLVIHLQPQIDVSGWATLAADGAKVNLYMAEANGYSGKYLSRIQPSILCCLDDTRNYYALHGAVPQVIAGGTKQDCLRVLGALQDQAQGCRGNARSVAASLAPLAANLATGATQLDQAVSDLNTAANGSQGTLASIRSQLSDVDHKIAGDIIGIVIGGLVVVGGIVACVIGVVANVVTAGAGTNVVLGGVVAFSLGSVAVATSTALLVQNLKDKENLLKQESSLIGQVQTAVAMASSYSMLRDKVQASSEAASQMDDAWKQQGDILSGLASDVQRGILDTATLQASWAGAQGVLQQASTDIQTVQDNVVGTMQVRLPKNASLPDYVSQFSQPTTPAGALV